MDNRKSITTSNNTNASRSNRKTSKNATRKDVALMIKSMEFQNKQLKWAYNDSTPTGISTTMSFFDLTSQISVGTTLAQRVGSSVLLRHLKVDLSMTLGDTTNLMRFVVFKWRPSTTVDAPQVSELFDSTTNVVQTSMLLYQPSRFKILYDKTWHLDVSHTIRQEKFVLKLDVKSQFDTGVNTGQNHIYCCYVSDSGAVPHPQLDFVTQLSWVDTE